MNDKILFPYSSLTKELLVKSQNHFFVDTIAIRKLIIHFETLEVHQILFMLLIFCEYSNSSILSWLVIVICISFCLYRMILITKKDTSNLIPHKSKQINIIKKD